MAISLICALATICFVACAAEDNSDGQQEGGEVEPGPGPDPDPDPDPQPQPPTEAELLEALNRATTTALSGKEVNTAYDVLDILGVADVDFTPINTALATSGHILGLNISTKLFTIIDTEELDGITQKENIFISVKNATEFATISGYGFSVYLLDNYAGTEIAVQGVGLDVGTNAGITSVTYTGATAAHSVIIRTNGGDLTVNAANDTVKHYGSADSVNIVAVAASSYHENGTVGYANISTGRFVIEESAEIEGIYLVATQAGEFDGIKLATVGTATLPTLARSDVELTEGQSKLVVEVQTLATSDATDEDPEFIWITGATLGVDITVSSTDDVEHFADLDKVVAEPSKAAEQASDEVKESAIPVSDNSEARIGAVGYNSLKAAIEAAKKGEKIYLLKDCTVAESIGELSEDNINAGLYVGSLANEIILANDVEITFESGAVIYFTEGGKISLNGYELKLTATSAGSGLYYCQMHYDGDNVITFTANENTATIVEDLAFVRNPETGFIMGDLIYGTEWTAGSSFDTAGYYLDARTMKQAPTLVDSYTLNKNDTQELTVEAKENAKYVWTDNAFSGVVDILIGFNEEPSETDNTATVLAKDSGAPMMSDATRYIYCDVFEADGTWYRCYWVITIKAAGGPPILF